MREKKRCFSHDFFTRFRAHFGVAREAKTTPKRTSEHPKRLPLAKRFSGIVSGRLSDGFRSSRPSRKHAYSVFSCTLHFSAKVGKTFGKVARKDLENHAKSSRRGSRERLRSARENRTRNSSISAPFWGPRGRPKGAKIGAKTEHAKSAVFKTRLGTVRRNARSRREGGEG